MDTTPSYKEHSASLILEQLSDWTRGAHGIVYRIGSGGSLIFCELKNLPHNLITLVESETESIHFKNGLGEPESESNHFNIGMRESEIESNHKIQD